MRRFSSEGSLLSLDFLSYQNKSRKDTPPDNCDESGPCRTIHEDGVDRGVASLPTTPTIVQNAVRRPGKELKKEVSFSVENLTDLDISPGLLKVTSLNDSFKAYSDSQLAPASGSDSGEKDDTSPSPSCAPSGSPFCFQTGTHQHRSQVRSKLSAAKLHLKSLFGQSPNSSHSNLSTPEHGDSSAKERRSRFVKQWSQVGHAKTRLSRGELERWAKSLDAVLECRVGVSVFEAFLRSEFSEENLQFYLACEQYRHSSTTFTLQRRAKEINAMYLQPGAPREVNLDGKTRDLTLQLLKAPSHNSLCHAQKRIRSLLESDCYPRFLQSDIYLTLLEDAH